MDVFDDIILLNVFDETNVNLIFFVSIHLPYDKKPKIISLFSSDLLFVFEFVFLFSQSLLTLDLIEDVFNRTPVNLHSMEMNQNDQEFWKKNTDYFRMFILHFSKRYLSSDFAVFAVVSLLHLFVKSFVRFAILAG